jgi:hypothetical protein
MCLKRRIRTPRAIPAFSHARGPRSDNQVPARRARTNTRTNETHARTFTAGGRGADRHERSSAS